MQERSNWVKNCKKLNKCKIKEKGIFFRVGNLYEMVNTSS